MEAALSSLDDASNEAIKSAGSRVFFATAISQFGALDAMLVLGVQSKLIWDVSHVYYQRPTIRDLVYLYANVMSTAFLATELDDADLSEQIQPVLTSVLGSAAGVVPGLQAATALFVNSVVSGTANAYLTLRVGIIAREYSRALVRPRKAALRKSAVVQAAGMLGSIAAGVRTDRDRGGRGHRREDQRRRRRRARPVDPREGTGAGGRGRSVVVGDPSAGGAQPLEPRLARAPYQKTM